VPKSFFFEKPNKTKSFFRIAFQSTLLKHAGEVLFVLRNADFFKFKKHLGTLLRKGFAHKSPTQRANNASWLISYFDVLLWAGAQPGIFVREWPVTDVVRFQL